MDSYNTFSLDYYKKNKIDKKISQENDNKYPNMKPIYSTNETLMCGVIDYNNKTYLVDQKDKDRILNFNKNFLYVNETDIYPSYCCNYKKFNYLDFIFGYNSGSVDYEFINNNQFDLRRGNIKIYYPYHKNISEKYDVLDYIQGHYLTAGRYANTMKNPIWKIKENDKEYLLMYCEKDTICKLCSESYQKILDYETEHNNGKKITWTLHSNGYILGGNNYYIHQVITGCYGNGKGTKNISVDHIDQDPTNNTYENLRIATRKEQEQNSNGIKDGTKRARNFNAQELPEGITQEMQRKYVYYSSEKYGKDQKVRDYFRVTHPKLDKDFCTTKSMKVSIHEKLAAANKIVDDLENDIYPEKKEAVLPKYVSSVISREKPHLIFEKRVDGKRLNIKMVLPSSYDLDVQLVKLSEKVKEKYGIDILDE